MPQKVTYWVRSKEPKEASNFGGKPIPAKFKTLEEAKLYRRDLNLHRGAFHPGYVVDIQDDSLPPVFTGLEKP